MSEWWRSLLVNGEATSHRQRLTEGRAEEEGLGLPLPLSAKVPHRYAILLFSWDVDDSLVGQLTKQRWHIAKLCFLYYMDADNLVGLPSPFYQTRVRSCIGNLCH